MSMKLVLKSLQLVSREEKISKTVKNTKQPKSLIKNKKKRKRDTSVFRNNIKYLHNTKKMTEKIAKNKDGKSVIDTNLILEYYCNKSKSYSAIKRQNKRNVSDFNEQDLDFEQSTLFDDDDNDNYDNEQKSTKKKKKEPTFERKK